MLRVCGITKSCITMSYENKMAFFFLSANLLALVVSASSVKTSKGQTPNVGFVFADFLAHKGYYLNVTTVGTELVQDSSECAFKCLEKDPCLSFNLADLDDNIDNLLCELLPSDHYTHSDKFITNHLWYHYSIASPCSRLPCQNNGTCVPLYRTNSFKCRCTKAYKGSHCENVDNDCSCSSGPEGKQRCKIEYLMVFPELRSTENYAMKNRAITSDLSQLSLCFFIKLVQDQEKQNVVSYASKHDNDMILAIHPTVFTVGNKNIGFTSTNLYDDTWQHLCLTWENTQGVTKLYKDGQLTEQVTNDATKNYVLRADGFLVLGQEQDSPGGGFDRKQTFHGRLASVNIWDKVLSEGDIAAQYTNCSIPHGSVINWSVFKNLTHGNVTVEEP